VVLMVVDVVVVVVVGAVIVDVDLMVGGGPLATTSWSPRT
jgi:hypothetical protein